MAGSLGHKSSSDAVFYASDELFSVAFTPCYRITLENGSYGVETYINADSKIQITFEDGNTLIGYIECVEYGTYSDENDTLVIRGENGELYILLENRIKDIEELHE